MATYTIDESQRKAAKVVGFTYLLALVTSNIADVYVPTKLIVDGNAAQTAANIMAHERLFRLGIACDLTTFATDIVLIAALYVVLKPVNRGLSLLAAFWRLVETSIMVVAVLKSFDVLRLLSRAAYLRTFETDRLQALAMLSIGAYGAAYNVGLMFFGLGSTVFAYLWFKSRYIPRALSALGVFGSLLLAVCMFAFIIFPNLADVVGAWCFVPIAIFELTMGFWLLIKPLPQPDQPSPIS
ncbi:MAG: DUF4386 domain-containing protein [Candidatus Acidiferrales bacterium]